MPNSTSQTAHRRTLAVKHSDGEPLTRADLQYDLLHNIFSNTQAVFTDPYRTLNGEPPGTKVTFRDLYINSLLHSPRCSKASRDKIVESPEFGVEFAKMSLLSNVGRINTTMAFFPEMRTALRTYHPVPSLQKTNGNLQDAPRIKNILKSCYLENESQGDLPTPTQVLTRSRSGQVPPASIVNVIFAFSTHAAFIARSHFEPNSSFDLLDFFTPIHISSESRARAFLWLCYHYHEASSYNPFSDDHANAHPGQIPALHMLSHEEAAQENVDPPDEREWGERMTQQRREFMENKLKEEDQDPAPDKEKPKARGNAARGRERGKAKAKGIPQASSAQAEDRELEGELSPAESFVSAPPTVQEGSGHLFTGIRTFKTETPFLSAPPPPPPRPESPEYEWSDRIPTSRPGSSLHYSSPPHYRSRAYDQSHHSPPRLPPPRLPDRFREPFSSRPLPFSPPHSDRLPSIPDLLSDPRTFADPYPRRRPISPSLEQSSHGRPSRTRARKQQDIPQHHVPSAYSYPPYIHPSNLHPAFAPPVYHIPKAVVPAPQPVPRRTMLEQAWHVVMTTDPLRDSDEEDADENTRLDYVLRLRIISRLRGKDPTPEPEVIPPFVPIPPDDTISHSEAS